MGELGIEELTVSRNFPESSIWRWLKGDKHTIR